MLSSSKRIGRQYFEGCYHCELNSNWYQDLFLRGCSTCLYYRRWIPMMRARYHITPNPNLLLAYTPWDILGLFMLQLIQKWIHFYKLQTQKSNWLTCSFLGWYAQGTRLKSCFSLDSTIAKHLLSWKVTNLSSHSSNIDSLSTLIL